MFGACFGHQAIAEALGGKVITNPGGWELGAVEVFHKDAPDWCDPLAKPYVAYAAHLEQVGDMPEGAQIIAERSGCPVAGFRIGNIIYTTQYHPEMDNQFITELSKDLRGKLPDEVIERSLGSLSAHADQNAVAESAALFFEAGRRESAQ